MENSKVSLYKGIRQFKEGVAVDHLKVLEGIKSGRWFEIVQKYRDLPQDTEEELKFKKSCKQKWNIPNFTGSGVFEPERGNKYLKEHSGYIYLDIDNQDDPEHLKDVLSKDKYITSIFASLSGNGIAVIVKIDPEQHDASFPELKQYFETNFDLDIKVDKGVREVARARFVSYDPKMYLNLEAETFIPVGKIQSEEPKPMDYTSGNKGLGKSLENNNNNDSEFKFTDTDHAKNFIIKKSKEIIKEAVSGEIHHRLLAAANLIGGYVASNILSFDEAFEVLSNEIKSKSGVHNLDRALKTIKEGIDFGVTKPINIQFKSDSELAHHKATKSLTPEQKAKYRELVAFIHENNRAGIELNESTALALARQYISVLPDANQNNVWELMQKIYADNKDEFNIDNKPPIVKIEIYLKKNYDFRRNTITDIQEFKYKDEAEYTEINHHTIWRDLQHAGFVTFGTEKIKSLLKSDFVLDHNPIESYFENLPKWDGQTDHIQNLSDYILLKGDNDEELQFLRSMFKKFLVRSVACGLGLKENRFIFVLKDNNEQEVGKTSFIRFLNPFRNGDYYTETPLSGNKDDQVRMAENFIYNIDELDGLGKFELKRLKAIISTSKMTQRKAYRENASRMQRICNFFASSNEDNFLHDSKNSRWLIFEIKGINWDYSKEISIHQVWAQAYALHLNPDFNAELTREEKKFREDTNQDYLSESIEKDLIEANFEIDSERNEFYRKSDIFEIISQEFKGKKQLNVNAFYTALKQLGFENGERKINGKRTKVVFAKKIIKGLDIPEELF